MSNRSDAGSASTAIVHAPPWRSVPSKRNILDPFCCLESTSCVFVALWPRRFRFIYVIQLGFVLVRQDICQVAQWLSNTNVRLIPFSRPNVPKSTHFFLYMSKLALNFFFLTTVCGVCNCIELHRNKVKWDTAPTIRAKRKCCRKA